MASSISVSKLIRRLRSNSGESGNSIIRKKFLARQAVQKYSCFCFGPLNSLASKCYSTAEVACSVKDDGVFSNTEGEGSLNSKQKKAISFQKSVADLDNEIQKLIEQRKVKLVLLEQLKAQEVKIQGSSFQVKMEEADNASVSLSLAKENLKHSMRDKFQRKKRNGTTLSRESTEDGTKGSHVAPVSLDVSNFIEEIARPKKLGKESSALLGGKIRAEDGSVVGVGDMNIELPTSGGANITVKTESSTGMKCSQRAEEEDDSGIRETIGEKENKQEIRETQSFQDEVHQVALEVSGILQQSAMVNSDLKSASTCDLYATQSMKENETTHDGPYIVSKMPQLQHPWSEWILFLEDLSEKNYFRQAAKSELEGELNTLTLIKHAVVEFGRNRDDIFRFLPRKDLRVIANFGCPGLEKKSVTSSKRLRTFFAISEGDVCQQCKLKNSCTRAFLKPVSQTPAGTLDVVRALFSYSIHALPDAEFYISYPEEVKKSICNILKKIVELNAFPRDPNLPKLDATKNFFGAMPSEIDRKNVAEKTMHPIAWKCTSCNYLNSSKQYDCSCCGASKPVAEFRTGDWMCSNADCQYLNFSRNRKCLGCGTFRHCPFEKIKAGDWECPNPRCRFMNFARNQVCLECETERPEKIWAGDEYFGRDKIKDDNSDEWGHADISSRSSYLKWSDRKDAVSGVCPGRGDDGFDLSAPGEAEKLRHKKREPVPMMRGINEDKSMLGDSRALEEDDFSDTDVLPKKDIENDPGSSDNEDECFSSSLAKSRHERKHSWSDNLSENAEFVEDDREFKGAWDNGRIRGKTGLTGGYRSEGKFEESKVRRGESEFDSHEDGRCSGIRGSDNLIEDVDCSEDDSKCGWGNGRMRGKRGVVGGHTSKGEWVGIGGTGGDSDAYQDAKSSGKRQSDKLSKVEFSEDDRKPINGWGYGRMRDENGVAGGYRSKEKYKVRRGTGGKGGDDSFHYAHEGGRFRGGRAKGQGTGR